MASPKKVAVVAYRYLTLFVKVHPTHLFSFFTFYLRDLFRYRRMRGAQQLRFIDSYPILDERTSTTAIDKQYFYQSVWAASRIRDAHPASHVDVGSLALFVGMLTPLTKVVFVDIRPLDVELENLICRKGSILKLPFKSRSLKSVSSLHVAEHIGLGRYGDPLDPLGTLKAAKELSRVLAKGGILYFSLPVGRERVCFNAHRIYSPLSVIEMFPELKLAEFSVIDDHGHLRENADPADYVAAEYSCGLFKFVR